MDAVDVNTGIVRGRGIDPRARERPSVHGAERLEHHPLAIARSKGDRGRQSALSSLERCRIKFAFLEFNFFWARSSPKPMLFTFFPFLQ